jgi:hypothetical protein
VTWRGDARFRVGIDPGVQTGFAVYDQSSRRLVEAQTSDFWSVYEMVRARFSVEDTEVFVECPGLHARVVFNRLGGERVAARRERIAGNVGSNRREATLMVEGLRRAGFRVEEVKPRQRKWTAEEFLRRTGYENRTSEHARDAARLIVP